MLSDMKWHISVPISSVSRLKKIIVPAPYQEFALICAKGVGYCAEICHFGDARAKRCYTSGKGWFFLSIEHFIDCCCIGKRNLAF